LPKKGINKWNPDWNPQKYLEQKKREMEARRVKSAAAFVPVDIMLDEKKAAK
jgi:hypothetical protein